MTAPIEAEVRDLEETTTIAVRLETTQAGLVKVFDTEMPRVGRILQDVGAQWAGPPFARYPHFGPDRIDLEIGIPIAFVTAGLQPISGSPDGIVGSSTLPGGRAAVALHSGPYDGLPETYDGLAAWITAEGHSAGDGPWEVYLADPSRVADPADLQTEVVWPIEPAGGR